MSPNQWHMLYTTVQMFGVGKIFWKKSLMLTKASFISHNSVKTVILQNIITI